MVRIAEEMWHVGIPVILVASGAVALLVVLRRRESVELSRRDWVFGLVLLTMAGDAAFGDQRPLFERQWKGAAAALFGLALGIAWWRHYRHRGHAGSRPSARRAVPVLGAAGEVRPGGGAVGADAVLAAGGTAVVTMPDLGQDDGGGTVTRWLKAAGETVEVDEPLVEVSTDKVDMEIPSPAAGRLLEIKVVQDDVAPVGAALAVIGLRSPD